MATKKFFTGPEMEALTGPLTAAQTALAVASFKIAARVANAAWSYVKALDTKSGSPRHDIEEMRAALHAYSPGNWPPPPSAHAYAAEVLQEVYNAASGFVTADAVLETIYEFATREDRAR